MIIQNMLQIAFPIQFSDLMITIFLRKTDGKGQKLHINPKNNVEHLLHEVKQALYNQEDKQNKEKTFEAIFRGNNLKGKENQFIQAQGIQNNSIVHIIEQQQQPNHNNNQPLRIKLILEGKLLEFQATPHTTILDFKHTVCQAIETKNIEELTLTFVGRQLDNTRTIQSYNFGKNVLFSAHVEGTYNIAKYTKNFAISVESHSESSDNAPKIVIQSSTSSPRKKLKKADSLHIETSSSTQLKIKNVYNSVQLKKIDEKVDESRNESQINQSEEISQEIHQEHEPESVQKQEWSKPKLTLDSLSKPWSGNQKIIQTQSIVDDDQQEQTYSDCTLQLVRLDHLREYTIECNNLDTFQNVVVLLAKIQRVDEKQIKLMINFDQTHKSAITNRSNKAICNSPLTSRSLKKQRNSIDCFSNLLLSPHKENRLNMLVVQWAACSKSKILKIEFQVVGNH